MRSDSQRAQFAHHSESLIGGETQVVRLIGTFGVFEALERIVDCVQNPVTPDLQHRREERRCPKVSAGCHVHILAEIFPERTFAWDAARCLLDDVIYSPDVERNAFTQMAENHLQIRVLIEEARRHQAQRVGAGLHRKGPSGRGQPGETIENRLAGWQRIARMHVKWLAERVRAFPEVGKLRCVVIYDRRSLGVGRAGAIVGPVVAAQLVALDWSSQNLFLVASVPASFSCIVVIGFAIATRRKLHTL